MTGAAAATARAAAATVTVLVKATARAMVMDRVMDRVKARALAPARGRATATVQGRRQCCRLAARCRRCFGEVVCAAVYVSLPRAALSLLTDTARTPRNKNRAATRCFPIRHIKQALPVCDYIAAYQQ
jgi:hypothetical protein